jgi:uncharacterized membrane protein (UPF0127 family)
MPLKIFTLRKNETSSSTKGVKVQYCDTFLSKGLGLMFRKNLPVDEGIMLANQRSSRIDAGIHMFFMHFDITVLWLDQNLVVVDKALARKWRPVYLPKRPAQFIIELHQDQFDRYHIGEGLYLENTV